ncbi:hypothetical protein HPB47_012629, partial [Ixodes persulcatus]
GVWGKRGTLKPLAVPSENLPRHGWNLRSRKKKMVKPPKATGGRMPRPCVRLKLSRRIQVDFRKPTRTKATFHFTWRHSKGTQTEEMCLVDETSKEQRFRATASYVVTDSCLLKLFRKCRTCLAPSRSYHCHMSLRTRCFVGELAAGVASSVRSSREAAAFVSPCQMQGARPGGTGCRLLAKRRLLRNPPTSDERPPGGDRWSRALTCRSPEHVERKLAPQNPGIPGSIPASRLLVLFVGTSAANFQDRGI